jgi:signal peptidase I
LTAPAPVHYPPPTAGPGEQPRRRSKTLDLVIETVTTIGLALVLYLVIQTFVVQTFRVEQQSMLDSLQPDQHLLIDKLTPRFDDYSRGDIIVFHPRGERDSTPFIKRVVGVGGETIEIRDGYVWIDGERLDEPYTYRDPVTGENEPTEPTARKSEWTVPDGSLFVLGDHRQASTDSRSNSVGLVDVSDVVGRAWLRFFPLDTIGLLQTPTYAVDSES